MIQKLSSIAVLATLLLVAGCVTPSDREGDRLQRVGEQAAAETDTSGLGVLQ